MKQILSVAALSGALCVALGAFGAHGLKSLLPADLLLVYETGVRYQFYHTLALLFVALYYQQRQNPRLRYAAYCFIAGIVLFSGSLYALVLTGLAGEPVRWIGAITPLGGVSFIAGWVLLFIVVRK